MNFQEFQHRIDQAARIIGKNWPLYSFVTANPLSGYENLPFFEAITEGGNLLGGCVLPDAWVFRKAWEENKIGVDELRELLRKAGKKDSPESYLAQLEARPVTEDINNYHELDRLTVKWLSLFLDEGMAPWPMPFKEMGFYTAWRKLIVHDGDIKKKLKADIPLTPQQALCEVLADFDEKQQILIFQRHLAALPGWSGFIKYRVENGSIWNEQYPVSFVDYLAVRLWMARCLKLPVMPALPQKADTSVLHLKYLWLQAWELTWQNRFLKKIKNSAAPPNEKNTEGPDAQLVFCLDTRSERLRRHLEKTGNYETFGSAGAFGLLMDYLHPETGLVNKSSPAMVPSRFLVHEAPVHNKEEEVLGFKQQTRRISAYKYFLKRMKNILPSAFGYVEGSGFYYGAFMLLRLFRPNIADRLLLRRREHYENIYEPHICAIDDENSIQEISMKDKAALVKGTFDSCGWTSFAPLVVFTGHASHSSNNPYASALDCGACAGHPGKRNARTLARLANSKEVRTILSEQHGIVIPEDTVFIAAEHITSTDDVQLFDAPIPESHQHILHRLKKDLALVRTKLTKERLNEPENAEAIAKTKSNSWSDPRPEWGLSGHGGYIIGPRSLTRNGEFNDCFMSSYDWQTDQDGSILKEIMQGPLVVVQWISNHYYFSTVDNDRFGAGSKITHNITGKYGVIQGNGSDLKMGLPLQSLMRSDKELYHNPIRLTTLIQAPKRFIDQILQSNKKLQCLLNNGWIHLFIMDPERNNQIEIYNYQASD